MVPAAVSAAVAVAAAVAVPQLQVEVAYHPAGLLPRLPAVNAAHLQDAAELLQHLEQMMEAACDELAATPVEMPGLGEAAGNNPASGASPAVAVGVQQQDVTPL
jgi:hypothetical protein